MKKEVALQSWAASDKTENKVWHTCNNYNQTQHCLMTNIFIGELIGTFLLILLGNGVVANVVLNKTKGNSSGWMVIAFGWGMAVFVGVFAVSKISGAHLNPAVTVGMACLGKVEPANILPYIGGQMLGAMTGATAVWLAYKQHFDATADASLTLAVFSTGPAIRSTPHNMLTEFIGTFALLFALFLIKPPTYSSGSLDALPAAFVVLAIGLSLGGPTGYAINPARDLGPRIMHAILPMPNKGKSDWGYAWIPVIAPLLGAVAAALLYMALQPVLDAL
jgi:glycerol uptake facilitator protein